MTDPKYAAFTALDPFFDIVQQGLAGLVDGDHYFDTIADDAEFEFRYHFPGWPGRDQLLAEIWGGETAEQNVPDKIEGEPEHDRCEPAVAQKKPALEYVGEIKRLRR